MSSPKVACIAGSPVAGVRWALRLGAALTLTAALLGLQGPPPAQAQTITVTTTLESPGGSGDCTLGEALEAASTNAAVDACAAGASSDLIVLQAGATYTLTSGVATTYGPTAYVISSTLTLQGNGASLAHNPGGGPLRFFYIMGPGDLTLTDLTLRGARAVGADGADGAAPAEDGEHGQDMAGGAVFVLEGRLTLDGVTFFNNRVDAGRGGDGYTSGPNSTDGGEGGFSAGGAVYSRGVLAITAQGATFRSNEAHAGNGGMAGSPATAAGDGGGAVGGAVTAYQTDFAPGAFIVARDNLAQGGRGGGGGLAGWGGDATGGAAFFSLPSAAALTHSTFRNNRAIAGDIAAIGSGAPQGGEASGGGLATTGQLTLTYSLIVSNTAQGGDGHTGGSGAGGGLLISNGPTSTLTLLFTQVYSNVAAGGAASAKGQPAGIGAGGGLYSVAPLARMEGLAVVGNFAIAGVNTATLEVADGAGGGLAWVSPAGAITNSTLAHNTARQGGGVFVGLSVAASTLTHLTIYSNTAETGGGIYQVGTGGMLNSVVAFNTTDNCLGTLTLEGDNIQFPGGTCGLATSTDPLLGTLADHGGGTLTVDLLPNSPAIGLAGPAFCPATDQRGVPRPLGPACDLGAYEFGELLFLPLLLR